MKGWSNTGEREGLGLVHAHNIPRWGLAVTSSHPVADPLWGVKTPLPSGSPSRGSREPKDRDAHTTTKAAWALAVAVIHPSGSNFKTVFLVTLDFVLNVMHETQTSTLD